MFDSGSKGLVVEPIATCAFVNSLDKLALLRATLARSKICTISDICQYKFDTGQYDADPTQSYRYLKEHAMILV